MRGGRSSVALPALAEGLEEDFEVVLVDLEDARVEGAVPCARVAALLGVEEGKAKFAVALVRIQAHEDLSKRLTSCGCHQSQLLR